MIILIKKIFNDGTWDTTIKKAESKERDCKKISTPLSFCDFCKLNELNRPFFFNIKIKFRFFKIQIKLLLSILIKLII